MNKEEAAKYVETLLPGVTPNPNITEKEAKEAGYVEYEKIEPKKEEESDKEQ